MRRTTSRKPRIPTSPTSHLPRHAPGRATCHAVWGWLVILCALWTNGSARAEGPLRVGEVIVGVEQSHSDWRLGDTSSWLRIGKAPAYDVELIRVAGALAPVDVAIVDANTTYLLEARHPQGSQLWRVDVRSNNADLVADFPAGSEAPQPVGIEPGPTGSVFVLVTMGASLTWELRRIDANSDEQTLVATGPRPAGFGLGTDGTLIIGANYGEPDMVFDPVAGTLTTSTAAFEYFGHELDPRTGHQIQRNLVCCGPVEMLFEAFGVTDPTDQEALRAIWGDELPNFGLETVDPSTGATDLFWQNLNLPHYWFGDGASQGPARFAVGHDDVLHLSFAGRFDQVSLSEGFPVIGGVELPAVGPVHPHDLFYTRALAVRRPQCLDGIDNDGDGHVDTSDPHCDDLAEDKETSGCTDGLDNDNDGTADFAGVDTDGDGVVDVPPDTDNCPDHLSDAEIPACADGKDNDGVGGIDRFDVHCKNGFDNTEAAECSDGLDNNGNGLVDLEDWLVCAAPEQPCEGSGAGCPGTLPACRDGWDNDGDGYLDAEDPDCIGNPETLSELPACADGIDNDGDGFFDLGDVEDCNELTGKGELSQCNDAKDNDGDGLMDFPDDPDCKSIFDDQEVAECSDGLDNDGDGLVDFGNDPDCLNAEDDVEEPRQCSDGNDNDGDGLVDHGDDPQCFGNPHRDSERPRSACSAGPMSRSPWLALLLLLAVVVGRQRRVSVGLRAAVTIAFLTLCIGSQASADGPLRVGETVVARYQKHKVGYATHNVAEVFRVGTTSPLDAESIYFASDASPKSVAITDQNTVYLLEQFDDGDRIWKIDVRSTHKDLVAEYAYTYSENMGPGDVLRAQSLAAGPNGDLLVLHSRSTSAPGVPGEIVRIDGTTWAQTTLVTSEIIQRWSNLEPGPDGLYYFSTTVDDVFAVASFDIGTGIVAVESIQYIPGLYAPTGRFVVETAFFGSPVELIFQLFGVTDLEEQQILRESFGDTIGAWGLGLLDPPTGDTEIFWQNFNLGYYLVGADTFALGPSDTLILGVGRRVDRVSLEPGFAVIAGGEVSPLGPVHPHDIFVVAQIAVRHAACRDGVDNDGDGLVDMDDPHCDDPSEDKEVSGCTDGVDNDFDGYTDLNDVEDCPDHLSDGEIPRCADGKDNDDDGLLDALDPHCANAFDDSEVAECGDGIDNNGNGKTDFGEDWLICASEYQACEGPSVGYECPQALPACSDGWDNDNDGYLDADDPDCIGNPATISELPACGDGLDNDGDGVFDLADPDCDKLTGKGELSQCNDGVDNDGDGLVDFPEDPDCGTIDDDQELARCADGLDNDDDGLADTDDPDCVDGSDDDEQTRQCSDGLDNDGDGLTDLDDPFCGDDPNKDHETRPSACSAGPVSQSPWAVLAILLGFLLIKRRTNAGTRRAMVRAIARIKNTLSLMVALSLAAPTALAQDNQGSTQFAGLATAPEANLFSGAMTTSVPIQIPPGRPNATPQLALGYSSGTGSGPFGYGWSLPLGTVERSTKHGRPRCVGWEDGLNHTRDFVLNLSGGTMEIAYDGPDPDAHDLHRYLPRIDESYVEAIVDTRNPAHDASGNTWVVKDRSGMTYRFAIDEQAGTITSHPEARAFHKLDKLIDDDLPIDCEFTSVWAMTQMEDPNGNTVDIDYFKEDNTIYPETISYGANPDAGLSEHPFQVRFLRAPRSNLGAPTLEISNRGVQQRMAQYIERIEVHYRPSLGAPYQLVRAYILQHTHDARTGRLLLTSVDDDPSVHGDLLPPQSFDYATSLFDHTRSTGAGVPGGNCPGQEAKCVGYTHSKDGASRTCRAMMDMNGDGFQDLVVAPSIGGGVACQNASYWTVYTGTTNGFSGAFNMSIAGPIARTNDDGTGGNPATTRNSVRATMDLTGDGIPDFIDATGSPWSVRPGVCTGTHSCGFGPTELWYAPPGAYVQKTNKSGSTWTTQWRLIDVNGDGRPDMVHGSAVYINTGSAAIDGGFQLASDATLNLQTASNALATGANEVTRDYFDFNGDGLPDSLQKSGGNILLNLNTGRGFGNTITLNPGGGGAIRFTSGGQSDDGSGDLDTSADFADVNGDGLPDRVFTSAGVWWVQYNQGGVRLDGNATAWQGISGPIRRDYLDVDRTKSHTHTRIRFLDFNGDGFVDHLNANGNVRLGGPSGGPDAKPLTMLSSHNGIGGTTSVAYAPASDFAHTGADGAGDHDLPFSNWVVTELTRSDGVSPPSVQTIHYADGLFDAQAREFRGFRTVTRTDVDGNRRVTTYGQDDYNRGKTLVDEQYAGVQLLQRETYTWGVRCLSPGPQGGACNQRHQVFLKEHRTEEFSLVGDSSLDRCLLNRNEDPDDWGRVTRTCSLSCAGAPPTPGSCANPIAGQVDTITAWADPVAEEFHVRERPQTIETSYINSMGISELLASKSFAYDVGGGPLAVIGMLVGVARGNLKSVRTDYGSGVNGWTVNDYDAFGNVVEVRDSIPDSGLLTGGGRLSQSVHDPGAFSLYAVTERSPTTGGVVHEAHTVTDLRFGKPTQTTGQNGEVVRLRYDGLGRIVCEARPGEDLNNCHTGAWTHAKEYEYVYGDPTAASFEGKMSYVEVRSREPNAPAGFVSGRQYTDGLGRKRLSTGQSVVGSNVDLSTVVVEHVDYDAAGRLSAAFVPYELTGTVQQTPNTAATTYSYQLNGGSDVDPGGRAHIVTSPDGHEIHNYFEGVRTRVVTARGTSVTGEGISIEDDFGRVIRKELLNGEGGAVAQSFSTTYDGMGRILTEAVSDDPTTLVRHTYDLAGRETMLEDPDSGIWIFRHDLQDNVIYRDDPESNQHVQWLFDEAGRLTHVCTFDVDAYVALNGDCGSGTEAHRYAYDDTSGGNHGLARLTRVDDGSGFEELTYDERGRVTVRTRDVLGIEAVTVLQYDDADRVLQTTYPDGEEVLHVYNAAGRVMQVKANAVYVSKIEYDLLGRATTIAHGNGVEDLRSYHSATDDNFRLASISTTATGTTHLDLAYEYNDLGKVSRIVDQRDGATLGSQTLSNDAAYIYDALGRLTDVDWLPGIGSATQFDDVFAYSGLGNITLKGGQPLEYDPTRPHQVIRYGSKTLTHDDNGRRIQKGSGAEAQLYTYDALDQLARIDFGNGDVVEYLYDYQGQRTAKRVNGDAWERYFGDSFESRVGDNGHGSITKYYFVENARVAMRSLETNGFVDTSSAVPLPLTIPSWFWALFAFFVGVLFLNPGRSEIRIGVAVGPARALGSTLLIVMVSGPAAIGLSGCTRKTPVVQHYHTDHLGSTQVVTDKLGEIVQQVRYAPYGEVRGRFDKNGVAIGETDTYRHEFTGYETDIESGLMYAGARYFDPELAQFLTHDPEEQYASPYAYGPGDPLNGTDPDGKLFGFGALVSALIIGAVAAAVSFTVTLVTTGSVTSALKSAGQAFGFAFVGALLPPLAASGTAGAIAANGVKAAMTGYNAYGAAQAAQEGNVLGAVLGAVSTVMGAKGVAEGINNLRSSRTGSGFIDIDNLEKYEMLASNDIDPSVLSDSPTLEPARQILATAIDYAVDVVEQAATPGGALQKIAGGFGKMRSTVTSAITIGKELLRENYYNAAVETGAIAFDMGLVATGSLFGPAGGIAAVSVIALDNVVSSALGTERLVAAGIRAIGDSFTTGLQGAAVSGNLPKVGAPAGAF